MFKIIFGLLILGIGIGISIISIRDYFVHKRINKIINSIINSIKNKNN